MTETALLHPEQTHIEDTDPTVSTLEILDSVLQGASELSKDDQDFLQAAYRSETSGDLNEEGKFVEDSILSLELDFLAKGDSVREASKKAAEIFQQCFTGTTEGRNHAKDRVLDAAAALPQRDALVQNEVFNDWFADLDAQIQKEIEIEVQQPRSLEYKDLSLVHATRHMPTINQHTGEVRIEPSYDIGFHYRNTVHFALNHHVESHAFGGWDESPIVIVAPMDAAVEKNGDPSSLYAIDTWFEARPGEGFVLPEDTIIVRPGASRLIQPLNNGKLRYKNTAFTEQDVTELFATATDSELVRMYEGINHKKPQSYGEQWGYSGHNGFTGAHKAGEDVQLYLHDELRSQIKEQLKATADEQALAFLNKLIGVRTAMEQQGRNEEEVLSTLDGGFRNNDHENALNSLRLERRIIKTHHGDMFMDVSFDRVEGKLDPEQIQFLRGELLADPKGLNKYNTNSLHLLRRAGVI